MPSDNTETPVARPDLRDDVNLATPKDPAIAPQEPQSTQDSQAAKESYDNYIKNLPPPFWATKTPQTKTANDAAKINAVCAPVTPAQRDEDERLKTMSWRERWRDRKAGREKNKDADLRPVERGSRAQLNVFGVNTQEKKGKR
ncbi:hypothetical protein CC86DRAFT_371114 [Ophiobolus disseminans]|uniref:Uncharacterized protein n=1 Tax=Ophiobolus disseminans TaxID=1469910 RepID=A0A6A6ZWL3_9PLEO|nr:hypothetical protein CC86DRAFT_371114 [Ophiobolus disseminans]